MMGSLSFVSFVTIAMTSTFSQHTCTQSQAVSLPSSATEAQLVTLENSVSTYRIANQQYLQCIADYVEANEATLSAQDLDDLEAEYNAGNQAATALALEWNALVASAH